MAAIRLLATDLDGTLIGRVDDFPLYNELQELLDQLRAKYGTAWVVCTGRRHRSCLRIMEPMRLLGLLPDYVIVRHAYIYKLTRWGYVPHIGWNVRILLHLLFSRLHIREAINEWYRLLTGMCNGFTVIAKEKDRLCLRFDNEEDTDAAEAILREKAVEFTHLCVFRFMREVDVRLVPFTKGLAVADLADRLGIDREDVLAIGDGHNDLSMLDGTVAGLCGCPCNAQPDVVEVVHRAKGHISSKRALAGVFDVIQAVENDRVVSDFPDSWKPTRETAKQHSRRWATRHQRHAHGRKPRRRRTIAVAVGVVYAVGAVFASQGMLPHVVLWPVDKLVGWIVKVLPF